MIPVQEKPEPPDFAHRVREPGQAFLRINSRPKSVEWKNRDYWRRSLQDLYSSYEGICAYSAEWIPSNTGVATVDHFIPKSVDPQLAYEWANYRLSSLKLNSRKKEYQDILDPFTLEDETFIIDFPSLIVKPNPHLSDQQKSLVNATIKRLGLNDEVSIKSRLRWIRSYANDDISLNFLEANAPFIAFELRRQNLVDDIKQIMR